MPFGSPSSSKILIESGFIKAVEMKIPSQGRRSLSQVGHLKSLHLPEALMPVGWAKPVVQVCPLEYVESPIEQDLPASVCHEVPGVDCARPVKGPAKLHAQGCDPVPDLLKISRLPLDVVRVRSGDELELDVLPVWLAQRHNFEKFH